MDTKELIEWLRGYALGRSHAGDYDAANMLLIVAGRMEKLSRRARIAEEQRNQVWEKLARITGEKEYERISQD